MGVWDSVLCVCVFCVFEVCLYVRVCVYVRISVSVYTYVSVLVGMCVAVRTCMRVCGYVGCAYGYLWRPGWKNTVAFRRENPILHSIFIFWHILIARFCITLAILLCANKFRLFWIKLPSLMYTATPNYLLPNYEDNNCSRPNIEVKSSQTMWVIRLVAV